MGAGPAFLLGVSSGHATTALQMGKDEGITPGNQFVQSIPSEQHKGLSANLCAQNGSRPADEWAENRGDSLTHSLREGRENSAGVTPSYPACVLGGGTFTIFNETGRYLEGCDSDIE